MQHQLREEMKYEMAEEKNLEGLDENCAERRKDSKPGSEHIIGTEVIDGLVCQILNCPFEEYAKQVGAISLEDFMKKINDKYGI